MPDPQQDHPETEIRGSTMSPPILKKTDLKHKNCDAVVFRISIECDPYSHDILVCSGCGHEVGQ